MTEGSYERPRPIRSDDRVAAFDCGEPSLDDYLRTKALANHLAGGARCYVTTAGGEVVGYYALAAGSVRRAQAPGRIARQMPEPVPVVLLGRLAVDRAHAGAGLGAGLLRDAILRTVFAAEQVGVRALIVNALTESAVAFYTRHGFTPSPTDPRHLMILLKDAEFILRADADA